MTSSVFGRTRRWLLAGVVALTLSVSGVAAAHASGLTTYPPPCPPHVVVGHDSNGWYVWPPGCGSKIYLPTFTTGPAPRVTSDCDGVIVTWGAQQFDIDYTSCPLGTLPVG